MKTKFTNVEMKRIEKEVDKIQDAYEYSQPANFEEIRKLLGLPNRKSEVSQ
jgi:hypothetical protein